jgi:ASC-1-like (ASCH) protein
MIHELKTVQPFYEQVVTGKKKFEVRKNDRGFKEGDKVYLQEYDAASDSYSGRAYMAFITYILDDPAYVKDGFVIFGFE